MGKASQRRRITKRLGDELIKRLVQADRSPAQLAEELGISLAQLSQWVLEPASVAVLRGLAQVADARTQLLLSNFRANAAIQLIQIAAAKEPTELSRKACVDLLTTDLKVFDVPVQDAIQRSSAVPAAPTEKAILRAFEQFGRMDSDSRET